MQTWLNFESLRIEIQAQFDSNAIQNDTETIINIFLLQTKTIFISLNS